MRDNGRPAYSPERQVTVLETLEEGEVGLLFLGMLHEVDGLLPEGIQAEFLIDRLPLREVEEP